MKCVPFANRSLRSVACPSPSRCPYCPADAPPHWTRWGSYERYSGSRRDPSQRVAVPRYWCKIVKRTFSLLPDGLLPYYGQRTVLVLFALHALFVRNVALNSLAGRISIARGTLRHLRSRFERVVSVLRLPGREGALGAAAFLKVLAGTVAATVVSLFRGWKEGEPKHSVVGIYVR